MIIATDLNGETRIREPEGSVQFPGREGREGLRRDMLQVKTVGSPRRQHSLLMLVLISVFPVGLCTPKVDPATGRIRMLMIGETASSHQDATYFLLSDPMVSLTVIPAGDVANVETSKRFVRIYVPRTREKLVSNYDAIELFDFVPYILEDKHFHWMHDAVEDEGLGLSLVEMGWYGVTDWTGNDAEAWMATVLYQAYPVDLVVGKQNALTPYMDVVSGHPLVNLPGLEKFALTGVGSHGIQMAREGSTVHTVWRTGREDAIVGGTYGSGTTLIIPMGWDNVPDATERNWDYYIDLVLNHACYVANVPLPDDPNLARALRLGFTEYRARRSLASSLIDFIGRFGANTLKVEKLIMDLEEERRVAEQLYVQGDHSAAWEMLDRVLVKLQAVSQESMKLRQRALLWIYLIEWLAIMATLLASTMVLWTLMVRRRLYRQVAATRSTL